MTLLIYITKGENIFVKLRRSGRKIVIFAKFCAILNKPRRKIVKSVTLVD